MPRALRLVFWGLRLAWAVVAGSAVRITRRLLRHPPRIWRGLSPMVWEMYLVEGDLRAGFPSRGAHRQSINAVYAVERDPRHHVVLDRPELAWDDAHWRFLEDLLRHGDIFVGYFESLFFRYDQRSLNEAAFRLLRWLGIRIIVCAHGGDVVHRTRWTTRFDWVGREQRDYPHWDLGAQGDVARERIRLFCEHADLVLPCDSSLKRFVPRCDLEFKFWPIDVNALQPRPIPERRRPLVVHAPNHRYTKGTDFLLAAIEALRARGIDCELQLVERVPRAEALSLYAAADIVADQFCMGSFGLFAVEGLALGKPVMCYLDQEQLGNPVFNLPVVNATPDNLMQILAVLLLVPALRRRLGDAGRRAVERYQSIEALSEVWARIYRHVWWREPLRLENTTHFEAARQPRSFCEDPAQLDFWPVPVDDLWPRMAEGLERAGSAAPVASRAATPKDDGEGRRKAHPSLRT
jgi:glycosyltransferase involved in cell wall biosynthesis